MLFKRVLIALDGSAYSQTAAHYGFWLAENTGCALAAVHAVDPRLVDLFIHPQFAEELGFMQSVETAEKVMRALKSIGHTVLDLFAKDAFTRGFKTDSFLVTGYVVEEILKRSDEFDLAIVGHRGRDGQRAPSELIGSVAERVAVECDKPVLIATHPVERVSEILVAYDGSEPAIGALLLGEQLANVTSLKLRALHVIPSSAKRGEAELIVDQGKQFLRGTKSEDVFGVQTGNPAKVLLDYAEAAGSLLVIGAYGFRDREDNVLGSTTTHVVRKSRSSILICR